MTGIIWACAATLLVALAPILAKAGTKKTDPALSGSISGIVFCLVIFFYARNQITGSNYGAIGQKGLIFILLAGIATGLFGICFFKSIHEGDASGVVSIVKCSYIIILIAGVFLFHANMVTGDYIVIALMVIGATVININSSGIPFALLAAVCAACASILILAGIAYPVAYDFYGRATVLAGSYATYIFNVSILVLMICASVVLKEKISGKKIIGAIIFIAALFFMK